MLIVGFDESHGETWTIAKEAAISASTHRPEYHYLGHLRDALTHRARCNVVRITKWDASALKGIHVLVLAHPAEAHLEGSPCKGVPVFSDNEKRLLSDFVDGGGGVLWINEYNSSNWGTNLGDVFSTWGLTCNNDTITAAANYASPHLLSQHFRCSDIDDHPVTKGVRSISYHRGCSISTTDAAKAVVRAPEGQAVLGVAECGSGRAAVVGDSDWLAIPNIGNFDNLQLFENLVHWLGRDEIDHPYDVDGLAFLRDRPYHFHDLEFNLEISTIAGAHQLRVSEKDSAQCLDVALGVGSPYIAPDDFLEAAELQFHELDRPIRRAVMNFKREGNQYGALLVRGLPQDPTLPDTPRDAKRSPNKKTFVSEFVLAMFSRGLGDPFAYKQEKDGELWHNICPVPSKEEELSSSSSTILLDFHTETAFHPYMPDFVLLHCLRADHENVARTEVASTRGIVSQLPLRSRALLFQPLFQTGIDASFGSVSGLKGNGPTIAVLYGDSYDPFMKYDLDLMVGLSDEAADALEQMRAAANASKNYTRLEPGDLLIVDNRRSVHSRSAFQPRWDGRDRWLQRAYVARDLAISEELRASRNRVFEIEFRV